MKTSLRDRLPVLGNMDTNTMFGGTYVRFAEVCARRIPNEVWTKTRNTPRSLRVHHSVHNWLTQQILTNVETSI